MNAKSVSTATIPPMSYPRRIRAAASLAWQTLRTGQYLPAVHYLRGAHDGMESGIEMATQVLAERNLISLPVAEKLTPRLTLVSGGAS